MAKQVKLKRLQEKNHGLRKGRRSRVGIKNISTSSPNKEVIEEVSPETRESQFGKLFEVFISFKSISVCVSEDFAENLF